MVLKVTQMMSQNTLLSNINGIKSELLDIQGQLSSGKRVNKPSDDPLNAGSIINLQSNISQNTQFIRNIDYTRSYLDKSESTLGSVSNIISRAKELSIQMMNSVSYDSAARRSVATEVGQLHDELISLGNTTIGSRYLFGGSVTDTAPVASGGIFYGNTQAVSTQVDEFSKFQVNTSASDVFVNDFNPAVSTATTIASLNKGAGVTLGSINITNRLGTTTAVDLSAATTVNDIITTINASGAGVTASINANKDGITVTDNSAGTPTSNLVIANADATYTASNLLIAMNRSGSTITSGDLDPAATTTTTIASLDGGAGQSLTSINIQNGTTTATVDLSTSTTLADAIALINASGTNVTATINSTGTGLDVKSNSATTVATVSEVGNNSTTASGLGISGGNNLIKTLETLQAALLANDVTAIGNSLTQLDSNMDSVSEARAIIGGKLNRVDMKLQILENSNVNDEINLTYLRDTDMTEAAVRFNQLQVNQNAALATSSKILNTSLVDFLR